MVLRILLLWALLLGALCLAPPLRAAGPEDTVRWIYDSLAGLGPAETKGFSYLSAPEQRAQYLSQRMVTWFEADDTFRAQNVPGCLGHSADVPGPGFDAAEINRTLTLDTTYATDRQTVTASFRNGGEVVRITYSFLAEDGFWRIDDVAGPGWRLSRISCRPRGTKSPRAEPDETDNPPYTAGAAQYCYAAPDNTLRLDVAADGRAQFALKSLQSGGHSCVASGSAEWIGDGWLYRADLGGWSCRMEIVVTSDLGLRIADRNQDCKPALCGPRATLDGLNFPRGAQVDCAFMPAQ